MPFNLIINPTLTPANVLLTNGAEADGTDIVFNGGAVYSRAIFDLSEPLVAGETYLLELTITDLTGGIDPQIQIVCAEGGPMNLVSGENRFTVREDITEPDKFMIRGNSGLTTARLSGFSLSP